MGARLGTGIINVYNSGSETSVCLIGPVHDASVQGLFVVAIGSYALPHSWPRGDLDIGNNVSGSMKVEDQRILDMKR